MGRYSQSLEQLGVEEDTQIVLLQLSLTPAGPAEHGVLHLCQALEQQEYDASSAESL